MFLKKITKCIFAKIFSLDEKALIRIIFCTKILLKLKKDLIKKTCFILTFLKELIRNKPTPFFEKRKCF